MSIFSAPKAFSPFYEDLVIIDGVRSGSSVNVTCRACVLDNGYEEAITDIGGSSLRRTVAVHVPRSGPHAWAMEWKPQVGDLVTNACGVKFAVYEVVLFDGDDFILKARQAT